MLNLSWSKNLLRPAIALVFLYLLVLKGPFQPQQISFILSQKKLMVLGTLLVLFQFLLASLRWKKIIEMRTSISLIHSFQLTLIGQFFSFFIPGGVSGDVVKALELSKLKSLKKSECFATVISDRVLGLFSMVLFSTLFLIIEFANTKSPSLLKYLFFSSLLLFFIFSVFGFGLKIIEKVSKLFPNKDGLFFKIFASGLTTLNLSFMNFLNKKIIFSTVLISLSIQLISTYFMMEVITTLNVPLPSYFLFFALSCFGFLASALPITPAGIGIGQAVFYYLFADISPDLGRSAVTAISVLQLFFLAYAVVGGIIFATKPFSKIKEKQLNDYKSTT